MKLSKKCLFCKKIFKNIRKCDGRIMGIKQFNNLKYCSYQCSSDYRKENLYANNYKIINKNISNLIVGGVNYIIDTDDIPKLKKYIWYQQHNGYLHNIDSNRKSIILHRLIMNCPDGKIIDHINRNRKDNRKENLRITDYSLNAYNSYYKKNTSGFKGVSFSNRDKSYKAEISYKKLGIKKSKRFKHKKDAILCRKQWEIELEKLIY